MQVGDRVEGCQVAAIVIVFIGMNLGAHLHQTLCACRTLGERVEAGFDGHDCQNERGV